MKCGDTWRDITAKPQQEHTIIAIYYGRNKIVEFNTGLKVGESPYDGNWSISWRQFNKEFRLTRQA